jgi:HSP20 family protein
MALPSRRSEQTSPSASPARFSPFQELEDLHDRMGRLMETAWSGSQELGRSTWSPPVDIEERDDAWIVEAEIPGVEREDINVELHDGELAISGEIKERERKGILRRRTRRVGEFDYRVSLPGELDAEGVEASLDGGVLRLQVPKPEKAQRRRIEIKGG